MSTSQCHLIKLKPLKKEVLRTDYKQCGCTSLQKLPTDQRLFCASGGSARRVNSSTNTLLVGLQLWQAKGQSDAIWFDAQDINIHFIPKQRWL